MVEAVSSEMSVAIYDTTWYKMLKTAMFLIYFSSFHTKQKAKTDIIFKHHMIRTFSIISFSLVVGIYYLVYVLRGRACSTHGREQKIVQGFGGKARREETTRKTKA
jgi:hypothetical protein